MGGGERTLMVGGFFLSQHTLCAFSLTLHHKTYFIPCCYSISGVQDYSFCSGQVFRGSDSTKCMFTLVHWYCLRLMMCFYNL